MIPVFLGALGSVTKNFEKYLDKIGIKIDLHTVQKTTLLGTARILRKVLQCSYRRKIRKGTLVIGYNQLPCQTTV